MKLLAFALCFIGFSLTVWADDDLGKLSRVKTKLDKLLVYQANKDPRKPWLEEWMLPNYPKADTGISMYVDRGYIMQFTYQFYLGFDTEREAHYKQSIPLLKSLFDLFMPSLKLSEDDIEQKLQTAKATDTPQRLTDGKRVVYFRYKHAIPEPTDTYRAFRVEFGPNGHEVSQDK